MAHGESRRSPLTIKINSQLKMRMVIILDRSTQYHLSQPDLLDVPAGFRSVWAEF